ncbi:ABC transporter substrate-binding protein [Nisaea nitritireducens]|uniref:ABC transporter substrate-binding protein n=1 Tax=Nisaea nitritireducens TaxID=568392 RepID=UPI0018688413|nr:ABC transporter substrate-binding protein [Nisaea nitritireducens]
MIRRKIWILFICLAVPLYGCGEEAPIRIGFIGDLEGRASDVGIASRNAVQMAIEEVNTAGGINGRQIQMLIRDDGANAAGGAAAAKDLVEQGVEAIIGPNLSSVAAGIVPVINDAKVVTISPTVSSFRFADNDDYFFRINSTTRQVTAVYAKYYYQNGYRRMAAATDANNAAFSESWLKEFRTHFVKLGGEISAKAAFDAKDSGNYSEIVTSLLATSPDGILLVGNGVNVAQLSQQIRRKNKDVKLIAAGGAASESLTRLGGNAVEGLELVQTYDRDGTSERFVRFKNAYSDRFKAAPGYSSVTAHDAATMLIAAIKIRTEGQNLKEAMTALPPLPGLQQELTFDEFGDSSRHAFIVIIKDGAYVRK